MTENEAREILEVFDRERKEHMVNMPHVPYFDRVACDNFTQSLNIAIKALEEIQQYRAIGTVEECRSAVEKRREKKPLSRTHCKDGNHPLSQDIGRCPCCNGIVAEDMIWCDDCGQKLDWSAPQ